MMWLWLLMLGCVKVVEVNGFVEQRDDQTVLTIADGRTTPLDLGEHTVLRALDGYLVELEAWDTRKGFIVRDWKVRSGLSGFQVWLGHPQVTPMGLGFWDAQNDVLLPVAAQARATLQEHLGQTMVLEGWIEQDVGLRVVAYRALDVNP